MMPFFYIVMLIYFDSHHVEIASMDLLKASVVIRHPLFFIQAQRLWTNEDICAKFERNQLHDLQIDCTCISLLSVNRDPYESLSLFTSFSKRS